ncbi:MAG: TldD/PmbA family protein [Archaeoglobi archaeon]|jgi:TldD protein|nr:MAG: TldD/PmbA family protein [Archaeoglobi archaeon]TDA29130.1 MAG: TldD/PmbA family protein [Archaeoglobi archaeon]
MFYDIREVDISSFTITLEDGAVEKPKIVNIKSKCFRVLKNGFWGVFIGDVKDDEGLREAERNVVARGDSEVERSTSRGKYEMKPKIPPWDVDVEEKIAMLKDLHKSLKVRSAKISYMENIKKFYYRDSDGSEVEYTVPRLGISIVAIEKGKTLQFLSKRLMKVGGFEKLKEVFKLTEEINEILPKLVDARSPPAGEMNVLMDSKLAGVFIHEAFGHAAEADHVLQGSSILSGKIGETIAGKNVTIVDDPTIEEFGFFPFDDEGVKAERKILVENGILKSYLHSRETAKKLKGKPGNARSEGIDFPIVRMSNTFLMPGDYRFDELLELCRNGVYLIGSKGGETNPATGYFHFSAQYGYIIKNGEISEMIRDVGLMGYLEILNNIKIGRNLNFDPGFCGKASQTVPVADGSPEILCRAKVGGE